MPRIHSLHTKIFLGYCLLGAMFVALIISALLQFHKLEIKVEEQQRVADFHDEIRYARRMEKNYLLYHKNADLAEAIEGANNAVGLIKQLPPQIKHIRPQIPESKAQSNTSESDSANGSLAESNDSKVQANTTDTLLRYRDLLIEMANADRFGKVSSDITDELLLTGSILLSLGEKFDNELRDELAAAVEQHHSNLQYTILAAITLAIAAGVLVTRSVVRPLRTIETSLKRVATGEAGRLDHTSDDLEVGSLTEAINRTLNELDERQKSIIRSSRLVALGTMLSGVAHELNNPLSNVSTSCQILLEEHKDMPEDMRHDLLAQIDGEVLRAQRIVSTLLDFAREKEYERHPLEIRQLVDEVLQLTRNLTPPGAVIDTDIPPNLNIDVDHQRFQQVLINLLQNAAGVVGSDGRIKIVAKRDVTGTLLSVEDNGPGISAENLPRIFDPFFSTKPVGKGTGLGLFIVHEIVSQHGGTVKVDSQSGKGARFSIHIPDHKKPESNTNEPSSHPRR